MIYVNPESLITKTDKLLYNIQELLIAQQAKSEPVAEIPEAKKVYDCKFCGSTHESKPQIMVCARKNKVS